MAMNRIPSETLSLARTVPFAGQSVAKASPVPYTQGSFYDYWTPRPRPMLSPAALSKAMGKALYAEKFPGQTILLDEHLPLKKFQEAVTKLAAFAQQNAQNRAPVIAEFTEVLDMFLQNKWDDAGQDGKRRTVVKALRELTQGQGNGNLVMAQINPTPGDIKGNGLKIMSYIDHAEAVGADAVIFPEMSLIGYPIRDVILRHPWLVDDNMKWLEEIAKRTQKTRAIVGFVEPRKGPDGQPLIGKPFYNSLAVLAEGKIQGIVRKSLLPTYSEFDDWRTFEPSLKAGLQNPKNNYGVRNMEMPSKMDSSGIAKFNNFKYGISICEDTWNDDQFFDKHRYYYNDPIAELAKHKPDVMLNISASPSRANKEQLKHNMLASIAKRYGIPYVYVNQVGAIDELSFDGASRVYGKDGKLIARAKQFKEQFMLVNPTKGEGYKYPKTEMLSTYSKDFNPNDERDLRRTYETLIQGIRDYFQKRGFTQRAVLGISGGLDSAVVATLLADALGPKNVLGIRMSNKNNNMTSSQSEIDAKELADKLGMHYIDMPITKPVKDFDKVLDSIRYQVNSKWGHPPEKTTTMDNIQARARAIYVWAIGNEWKAMPIATSDKSELYMGYTTIGGDMLGELAPIADLPKTKVRALAKWMNENRAVKNAIPVSTIAKKPGAELKRDEKGRVINAEDDLMPYEFLDEVIWRIEGQKQNKLQMMSDKENPFWIEKNTPKEIGTVTPEMKKAWLDKFYRLMNISLIKWWLAPPAILTGPSGSITKTEYRYQPLSSGRINWDGYNDAQVNQLLNAKPYRLPVPSQN